MYVCGRDELFVSEFNTSLDLLFSSNGSKEFEPTIVK